MWARRVILTFGLCISSVLCVFSQQIGLIAYAGPGWIGGSDWRDALTSIYGENELKAVGGVAISFRMDLSSFLVTEIRLAYQAVGGAYNYPDPWYFDTVNVGVVGGTVEIPLLIGAAIPAGMGKFAFMIGPALVFFPGDIKMEVSVSGDSAAGYLSPDNSFVLGIVASVTYLFHPERPGGLLLGLDYRRTLTEIFNAENTAFAGVSVSIGYLWQIGFTPAPR